MQAKRPKVPVPIGQLSARGALPLPSRLLLPLRWFPMLHRRLLWTFRVWPEWRARCRSIRSVCAISFEPACATDWRSVMGYCLTGDCASVLCAHACHSQRRLLANGSATHLISIRSEKHCPITHSQRTLLLLSPIHLAHTPRLYLVLQLQLPLPFLYFPLVRFFRSGASGTATPCEASMGSQ